MPIDYSYSLGNLRPFNATSLFAFAGQINGDLGRLPKEWQERYRADGEREDGRIVYTVTHHQTPIAWVVEDKHGLPIAVVIPDHYYSRTTAGQQGRCRNYLPYPDYRVTQLED
jgi:hypothetical protein